MIDQSARLGQHALAVFVLIILVSALAGIISGPIGAFSLLIVANVAFFRYYRSKTIAYLGRWAEINQYRVISKRRFMTCWDGVSPPFWCWGWKIFRIAVQAREGGPQSGWVRCDDREVLAVWDTGIIEKTVWCEVAEKPEIVQPAVMWHRELDR